VNLQDQGMRFYVHEDGSSRWMHPELAERQNKDGGWTDMTDASDEEFMRRMSRQNRGMTQSNREKQEAYRARQAMLGLTEVRGIYLPPELHQSLKDEARRMLAEKIDQAKVKT
jgi:hypothetical protein